MNEEELKILPLILARIAWIHNAGGCVCYIMNEVGTFADFSIAWEANEEHAQYTYSIRLATHKPFEMFSIMLTKMDDAIEFIKGCVK